MNKKAHLAGGILIYCGYVMYTKDFNPIVLPGVIFGSLLPDLDQKQSTISSKIKLNPVTLIQSLFPNNFTKHRGILLHSIWTIGLIYIIPTMYIIKLGLILGVVSHHLLDMVTKQGLKDYLYPIKFKRRIK